MSSRLLLNCAPISFGGALQASVAFVREALREPDHEWYFVISREAERNLLDFGEQPDAARLLVVDQSPARSAATRRRIADFVEATRPRAVFTFFGPAYQRFAQPHMMGVADGWVTHANRLSYATLDGYLARAKMLAQCLYKGLWYRAADYWVTEADCARQGLSARYRVDAGRIAVVPNNCAQAYHDGIDSPSLSNASADAVSRIVTLSAHYPHKNLRIIPRVAAALRELGRERFCFRLSLDPGSQSWLQLQDQARALGVEDCVETAGVVPLSQGREFYHGAAAMFMPSLLETFSASYPEAMAMRVPVVTVDMDHAHNICRDAALYYAPESAVDAAKQLDRVLGQPALADQLTAAGEQVLSGLPSPHQRYEAYRDHLLALVA